jgi:hypothetical protein
VSVFQKPKHTLNLVTPFSEPTRCHKLNWIFISQTGYLSAKRDIYQPNIYQPNIYQPNIHQPNKIFISQLKYLSAKWEYLSAKLQGGWGPKPGVSRPNHYIGQYTGRRANIISLMF